MSTQIQSRFGVNNTHVESYSVSQTILHIGLEKTGTTSIQHLLVQSRKILATNSVFIAESVNSGNNFHLAIANYSKFRADGLTRQLGIFDQAELEAFRKVKIEALAKEFSASGANKAIFSSEHFQSRLTSVSDLKLLKESLESAGFSNFQILLYLRDPLKIAMSHHGMAIKKGIHVTDDFYRPTHPRISQILGFKKTISMWQEVFGSTNLVLRLYPEGKPPTELLNDFLTATGLSAEQVDLTKQEKRNVNLSAAALEVLNEINGKSSVVRKLSEDRWLFNRLEQAFPGSGLSPTPEQIQLFNQHFESDFKDIARIWFNRDALFDTKWKQAEVDQNHKATRKAIRRLIRVSQLRYWLKKLLKK